jgi:prephenate dehydratase
MKAGCTDEKSEKAVNTYAAQCGRDIEPVLFDSREDMFSGLSANEIDLAVIEAEDSFHGRIEENFDQLYKRRFYVNAETKISPKTYFVISPEPAVPPRDKNREYKILVAITPHNDRPGLLRDISSVISIYRVNMTDIFSRPAVEPSLKKKDAKMFYIIMEGHIMDDIFQSHILEGIKSILEHSEQFPSFRFLGCYEAA